MNWRSTPKVLAVVLASAFTSACNAQQPSPDWNGTWKLNPSKSSFQGPVFSISISADGEYRYDDGSLTITFLCDGKDRPMGENRTRACLKSNPTVLDLTLKENGVKTTATHWELSPGGKVLMWTTTAFRASGPVIAHQFVASRISGFDDFAGQWRDTSYLQQHADLTLEIDTKTLHISYPSGGQYVDAPFDGAYVPVHGPYASGPVTESARPAGRREFLILTTLNGKPLNEGSLELSDDGRVITDSWWKPGQPTSKGTLVYERK